MMKPNILYYAMFEYNEDKAHKARKYTITASAGYYPPMEQLKGRDGKITVYLAEKLKEGLHVPSVRLQAKKSLNLTGLKDYYVDGKLSGYAYGNPPMGATYGKDKKINPFFTNEKDAFIFRVYDGGNGVPRSFELLVLQGAKCLACSFCKSLKNGGFDDELNDLRKQAGIGDINSNWQNATKDVNGVR